MEKDIIVEVKDTKSQKTAYKEEKAKNEDRKEDDGAEEDADDDILKQPDEPEKEVHEVISGNFYINFLKKNFIEEFWKQFEKDSEDKLKTNYFEIAAKGINEDYVNYDLNLSFIDFEQEKSQMKHLLNAFNPDTNIESLLLASNPGIKEEQLAEIIKRFSVIKTFHNLFVYNTGLNELALARPINESLPSISLEFLLISYENLGNAGLRFLADSFKKIKTSKIKTLTLTNVNVSNEAFQSLAIIVSSCLSLETISVSNNVLALEREVRVKEDVDLKNRDEINKESIFLKEIMESTSLINLNFVDCKLGKEVVYIIQALELNKNQKIKKLNFNENDVSGEHFKLILESLRNMNLDYLSLNLNKIGDIGMFYLYDYMEDTYPFNEKKINFKDKAQFIELEQNGITDKGAKILKDIILADYFYLKKLSLRFNLISEEQIVRIAEAIVDFSKKNEKRISEEKKGIEEVFKYLNISLIDIDIRRNKYMDDEKYDAIFTKIIREEYERFFK